MAVAKIATEGDQAQSASVSAARAEPAVMIVAAPILVLFMALVSRIYCEIMIVLFKINEALQDIRNK